MSGLRNIAIVVLMASLLTGCGGGSSSASGTVAQPESPIVSPPAVTPPPATFNYDKASDFTRDRSFTAIGTTATLVYAPDGGSLYQRAAALDAESDAIGFDYVASSQTYRARYLGDTFDRARTPITNIPVPFDEYAEASSTNALGLYFARTPLRAGMDYAGFVLWRLAQPQAMQVGSATRIHRMLFGSKTLVADLPTSGTSTYDASVEVSENEGPDIVVRSIGGVRTTTARIVIDWRTRALSGYVRLFPPSGTGTTLQSPVDYPVSGTIADDGLLTGMVASSGPLQGHVYGPRAVEVGLLFTYRNSTLSTQQYVGAVLGHQ
ncbi:hypothetical protein Q4F19_00825 [Sphingomonas sp. BIUV-7]|uniref:Uncharacterized protein n=1 Tax=Sphingomonas natans TaxID=3063330 RepID=A0ABT8Y3M8_9SPHN|nr:hypothetical protein [Sphingomonas sp. BIUV-7]MDO6412915.1 hypothetical protein [Sphingomonas sp. BIUV-7]